MIKKSICCFILIFISLMEGQAQERMASLLQERDVLYQQFEHYLSQNNAFFGGKSKKDLTNIINTLKQIISKDNEIIREVRYSGARKESNYVGQNRENASRLYELERNISSLRVQLKTREQMLAEKQDDLKYFESTIKQLRLAIWALTGGVIVLLLYIVQLRKGKLSRR